MRPYIDRFAARFGCAGRLFAACVVSSFAFGGYRCFAQYAQQAGVRPAGRVAGHFRYRAPPSKPTNQGAAIRSSSVRRPFPRHQSVGKFGNGHYRRPISGPANQTVPDALSAVPGLNVVQNGGPGGQTSIFIRGTNSNHVKVLIDGVECRTPTIPTNRSDFGQLLTGESRALRSCAALRAVSMALTRSAA